MKLSSSVSSALQFRDSQKTLDNFDFTFNKKMNRSLVFDLSTGAFIARHEDALFLGPPGTGKSHLAQAIGHAAIQQGYRVLYRETHTLLDELAEATLDGTRKEHMEFLVTVPLLILDDLGMRKLPLTAAEELLEIIMRRYYCTTATCSSAAREAGAPKPTCHHRRRQGRTFSVLDGHSRWPVLK
jgi:DNA replication protein DnaC